MSKWRPIVKKNISLSLIDKFLNLVYFCFGQVCTTLLAPNVWIQNDKNSGRIVLFKVTPNVQSKILVFVVLTWLFFYVQTEFLTYCVASNSQWRPMTKRAIWIVGILTWLSTIKLDSVFLLFYHRFFTDISKHIKQMSHKAFVAKSYNHIMERLSGIKLVIPIIKLARRRNRYKSSP